MAKSAARKAAAAGEVKAAAAPAAATPAAGAAAAMTMKNDASLASDLERDAGLRWVVDGEVYDLTQFLHKHPGGADLLLWCVGRDISVPVHTYHKDPRKTVLPTLAKYKVNEKHADVVKTKLGIPHFLLPPTFTAASSIPTFDFSDSKTLMLNTARAKILQPEVQKQIKRLDALWDATIVALMGCYAACVYGLLFGASCWATVLPLALLRTALAGGGHYYVHRKKPHFGDALFDLNYVGMAFTAQDGHVLLHHAYTQSEADVKRGFFGGMIGIPRLLRVPVHSVHKFLHVCTGMFVRGLEVELERDSDEAQGVQPRIRRLHKAGVLKQSRPPMLWHFWAVHLLLFVEMATAVSTSRFLVWGAQFFVSLWFNTLLVVSSHDFTETFEPDQKDWARFQVLNTHDIYLTGSPWVDSLLSAGLAEHRAHHIFPYQKSAFANIYSTKYLKEAALEHGMEWHAHLSFFTDVLPGVVREYLFAPVADPLARKPMYDNMWDEHTAPASYKYIAAYLFAGFAGVGSI
ncbi:hypothetical protein M885DRAFT_538832 [Pelagophyceae sp. CCMP2097]|nr:hypothetical protein M885DRAFT_538832 [Pelagophyceae sp. CCMP2097]